MNRRDFIKCGLGSCLAAALPGFAEERRTLEILPVEVKLGLAHPFRVLHVSDTHIHDMYPEERTDPDRRATWDLRNASKTILRPKEWLEESVRSARERGDLLVHTGDLIDYVSDANLDEAMRTLEGVDSIAVVGNHEWKWLFDKEKERPIAENRVRFASRLARLHPRPSHFARTVHGVDFVAIDNSDCLISEEQAAFVRAECGKGLPVVLLCHVPFRTMDLRKAVFERDIPESNLVEGNAAPCDPTTHAFCDYLRREPAVKAILCGHLHRACQTRYSPTAMEYVAGANFKGFAYEFSFA